MEIITISMTRTEQGREAAKVGGSEREIRKFGRRRAEECCWEQGDGEEMR